MKSTTWIFLLIATLLIFLILSGCATRNCVVVSTSTIVGFDLGENPTTQLYHLKFGYARQEVAVVPTNKGTNEATLIGNGAKDTADVITELEFHNLWSGGGLYQRVAVGVNAVDNPAAIALFSKDRSGDVKQSTLQSLTNTIPLLSHRRQPLPTSPKPKE